MKRQILIVDDELDLCDLLTYHLDDRQTEFHFAATCEAALQKVACGAPDLVLLDILLPDVDGLTLCQQLRAKPQTHGVPIVMMSAHDSAATRQLALAAGADAFFTKPLDLAAFKCGVKTLLSNSGEDQ